MKKNNFYFIAECVIIVLMLFIIGILMNDRSNATIGSEVTSKNNEVLVVEEEDIQIVEKDVKEVPLTKETIVDQEGEPLRIVVFGDSIWDEGRGEDGISEQIMAQSNVKIYNCAIGGTTAAVVNESTEWDNWTSKSFNGMMYIANGAVKAEELISDTAAYEIMKNIDFKTIDYVIVSYGLNDYFSDVPIYPEEYYDLSSYVGALRHGITKLKEEYPNLKIILTSPTYCEWFTGERQFELGTYVENARGVAEEMDVCFLDMYHAFGKNPEDKIQYLEDGVHLTAQGRALYANSVMSMLKELTKESK